MDIKDIKDKRQEVACKLRKLAKQEWMPIDIDDINHGRSNSSFPSLC